MSERALDQDALAVIDVIRASVRISGVTQRDFAGAVGTSPSRLSAYIHGETAPSAALMLRCQRIGEALGAARAESVPTSLDAAASVRTALAAHGRPSGVLRMVLEGRDRLRDTLQHRPHLADAWAARALVGDERWDTLLAALVEHEFEATGRPAPAWTRTEPLDEEWLPAPGRLGVEAVRRQTPPWLAEKRILLAESALQVA